jgi:hypothetical protein
MLSGVKVDGTVDNLISNQCLSVTDLFGQIDWTDKK